MCLNYFIDGETPRQMSTLMILENTSLHTVNYSHLLKISGGSYNIFLGLQILSGEGFSRCRQQGSFLLDAPRRSCPKGHCRGGSEETVWALGGDRAET